MTGPDAAAAAEADGADGAGGWVVDLWVTCPVEPPHDAAGDHAVAGGLDRQAFFEWAWGRYGDEGLVGIDEGSVDVDEAVRLGLAESPLVIDAAAAPEDRDWVGRRTAAPATWWFADEPSARRAARDLSAVRGCSIVAIRRAPAAAGDWRGNFREFVVPGFGTVRPAWEEGEAGTTGPDGEPRTTTLFIDPGIGFGTGEHATTRLCLEALAAWHDAGGGLDRVLDFGAGSGILGIAAALRGASHVAAIEIDTRVHEAIRANARRNGVHGTLRVATHLEDVPAACDLVIANIVAAVLLEHADPLCRLVRRPAASAGGLILSGLRDTDVAAVREAFSRRLDASPRHAARDGWHCLLFTASGR